VLEGIKDTDSQGKGVNVSARFNLLFTKERYQAINYIHERHIANQNKLLYFSGFLVPECKLIYYLIV
jgi:hypothetical protein